MKKVLIDAGSFDRQITIENEAEVADGCGGWEVTFVPMDTAWAHICPIDAALRVRGDGAHAHASHLVYLRHRPDLRPGSRLVTGSRHFEVTTVRDVDETGRYLVCEAREMIG